MTEVFVIRNQHGHYWGKAKQWVSGDLPKTVQRSKHEDEAINIVFELSSKDIELRAEVIAVELSERREPVIEPSQIPLPITADAMEEDPEPALTEMVEDSTPLAEENL